MRRFVYIQNERCHWIWESENWPEFSPEFMANVIEITDEDPQPQENWGYSNGTFIEPILPDEEE